MANNNTPMPTRASFNRLRMQQPVHRVQDQEYRRTGDERRLHQSRQRLGLAVAEAVLAVGRLQGVMHRQQVDDGCRHVHHRIHQRSQYADRSGQQAAASLPTISTVAVVTEA
jgi:hypothetical protein